MVTPAVAPGTPMVRNPETGVLEPMAAHIAAQINPPQPKPWERAAEEQQQEPINFAEQAERRQRLSRAELMEAIRPQRMPLFVKRFNANAAVEAMTAAQYDQHQAMQNTVVRLKRDGTAEYDAKLNQMRASIVCDHTYWEDGTKVFDQPTDPLMLSEGDNSIVSLLFGAIDEISSTTREQLDEAKNASKKTRPMS